MITTKQQVRKLWKLCFNDTEEFTDLYFKHKYNDDVNIAIENDGKVVAALQMLPYSMTLLGEVVSASYISGACTHPDYRGKGVMKELLYRSFDRMVDKKIPISFLIPAEPWLFNYYARMGYATTFRYSIHTLAVTGLHPSASSVSIQHGTAYSEEAYHYLNREMRKRPCCIQQTANDYRVILADLALSNGQVLTARRQGEVAGMALVVPKDDELVVKELFATDKECEKQLLYEASRLYSGCNRIALFCPSPQRPDEKRLSLGMARIVLAEPVLQLYAAAFPKVKLNIEVTGDPIAVNNGYYMLGEGKCLSSSTGTPSVTYQSITISELTQMILGPLSPYMSLMLD